jgi:hypothetical protein
MTPRPGAERVLRWAVAIAVASALGAGPAVAQEQPGPTPEATIEPVATTVATPVASAVPTAVATPTPEPAPTAVAAAETTAPPPAPTPVAPARKATPTPAPAPASAAADRPVTCVFPATGQCQISSNQCSILGTEGADTLIGGATADLICGLGGADVIDGRGGDDTVVGGDGDDKITGGRGSDCMFGGGGHDRFPGSDENDIVVGEDPGPHSFTPVSVDRHARCHIPGTAGGDDGGGSDPVNAGGGAVDAPVRGGALVLDIVNIVHAAESTSPAPFPVQIAPDARAAAGTARLLLRCSAQSEGRLVARIRGAKKPNLAGRAAFTCAPPTDVAEVELTMRARQRLARDGELDVTVRIAVAGLAERGSARVTLHGETP